MDAAPRVKENACPPLLSSEGFSRAVTCLWSAAELRSVVRCYVSPSAFPEQQKGVERHILTVALIIDFSSVASTQSLLAPEGKCHRRDVQPTFLGPP